MSPNDDITKLIGEGLRIPDRRVVTNVEIQRAKRLLPFPKLLRMLGDEAFLTGKTIPSPFHSSDKAQFRFYRHKGRIVFSCCKTCGLAGDQIDYLAARFKMTRGKAMRQFWRMAAPVFRLLWETSADSYL